MAWAWPGGGPATWHCYRVYLKFTRRNQPAELIMNRPPGQAGRLAGQRL